MGLGSGRYKSEHAGQGLPADERSVAEVCQHSSGCDRTVVRASYCEEHYRATHTPIVKGKSSPRSLNIHPRRTT